MKQGPISPVGVCIYCGKSGAEHRLTDEHIVPFALGGTDVLPASSCEDCTKITGRFEQLVLRGCLRGIKERLGLQTRSKNRPKTLPLFGINGNDGVRVDVPIEHYPAIVMLPAIPGPTLDGLAVPENPNRYWAFVPALDLQTLSRDYGIQSFATPSMDVWAFARMLAKIAHARAVADLGISAFQPCLPSVIISEDALA